jgi:hypothetical protein
MDLIPYRINKKVGYCTPDKTLIIPVQYDVAMPFFKGFAWVKQNGLWGLIKPDGTFHIEPKYEMNDFNLFQDWKRLNLSVKAKGKWGYMIDYQEIISPVYDRVGQWYDGVFTVFKNNLVAQVNEKSEIVVPFSNEADFFLYDILQSQFWKQKGRTIWNEQTKETFELPDIFDKIMYFEPTKNWFFCNRLVNGESTTGIINTQGTILFDQNCRHIAVVENNPNYLIFTTDYWKVGVMSADFQEFIPATFESVEFFEKDVFICHNTLSSAFINTKNEVLLPDALPKTAVIQYIGVYLKFIQCVDNEQLIVADLDENTIVSVALTDVREIGNLKYRTIFYQDRFYLCLACKNQTYWINLAEKSYILVDFAILQVISFFGEIGMVETYDKNYRGDYNNRFLYNFKTGKRDFTFTIRFDRPNYFLINGKTEFDYGISDKSGNIIISPDTLKGWQGVGEDNFEQFAVQVHKHTVEHHAWAYYYWVDAVNNIVYAEDLPVIDLDVDIPNLKTYKKLKIVIPETHRLFPYLKNNPTKRWRKSMKAGDYNFTAANIKDSEIILHACVYKMYQSPEKVGEHSQQVLLDIQELQRKYGGFIETFERDELYSFLSEVADYQGFDEVFEKFRSF